MNCLCSLQAPCEAASPVEIEAGRPAQFCENKPGTFACTACSAACAGGKEDTRWCSGPLAGDCKGTCAAGYVTAQ